MNDDFLYRLRTDPPAHFAVQLKEQLDRGATRKARVWQFAVLALLFGTAFAMVSPTVRLSVGEVIDWIRGTPMPMTDAKQSEAGLGQVFGTRAAESQPAISTATNDDAQGAAAERAARDGARALLESMQAERLRARLQNESTTSSDSNDAGHDGATGDTSQNAGASGDADTPSGFIVTGPLLDEYGTPAQIFHARRGYFTALSWYLGRLNIMAASRAPIPVQSAQTNARALRILAPMLPEFFSLDERTSTVPTRADRRIWDQPAEFEREANMFALSLSVLDASLTSEKIDEQGVRARIALVGRICAGCHDKFRKEGEKDVGAVTP